MKKCENPDCDKMVGDKKYCSKKCMLHAYYLRTRDTKQVRIKNGNSGKNRPITRLTVYLTHKWVMEGLSFEEIASITNSSIARITEAYKIPLTEKEKEKMEMYIKR